MKILTIIFLILQAFALKAEAKIDCKNVKDVSAIVICLSDETIKNNKSEALFKYVENVENLKSSNFDPFFISKNYIVDKIYCSAEAFDARITKGCEYHFLGEAPTVEYIYKTILKNLRLAKNKNLIKVSKSNSSSFNVNDEINFKVKTLLSNINDKKSIKKLYCESSLKVFKLPLASQVDDSPVLRIIDVKNQGVYIQLDLTYPDEDADNACKPVL